VQGTECRAAGVRAAAESPHGGLQLARRPPTALGTLLEQLLQVRRLGVLGAGLKAVLAVFAGLDQVVQLVDDVVVVHGGPVGVSGRTAFAVPAENAAMLTVHHLNNSRSQRVLWLLEELGVAYEIRKYQRDATTMLAPPELLAVHPLGKSPVVTEGDVTLAETGAIVEELTERHGNGRLVPSAGTPEKRRYTYWLHFAEGSAMSPLLMKLVFDRVGSGQGMPFFVKPVAKAIAAKVKGVLVEPNLARQLDFMEAELGKSAWFAGAEFTAADIMMSFPVEAAKQRAGLDASRPRLIQWLKTIHARPAYRRALERGGPYSFAGD
jgi:glutathione S-transferase